MNSIQNTIAVGAPSSVMRGREAIEKGLIVCGQCYTSLEFATGCGPFTSEKVKIEKGIREYCYVCEVRLRGGFKLERSKEGGK